MPDPATPPGATPEAGAMPAGVSEPVPPPEGVDETELGEGGKAAIATMRRELRALKAERDELARVQREAEDAKRSELEKATSARDEATANAQALEHKLLKMQAAIDAGIPGQWMRLTGTTADELTADAKAFATEIGQGPDENGGATPAELGAGPRPGTPATGNAGFNAALRARARR